MLSTCQRAHWLLHPCWPVQELVWFTGMRVLDYNVVMYAIQYTYNNYVDKNNSVLFSKFAWMKDDQRAQLLRERIDGGNWYHELMP